MVNLSFALDVLEQFGGKFFLERNMGASAINAGDKCLGFRFSKPAKNHANLIAIESHGDGYVDITFWRIDGSQSGDVSTRKGVFFTDMRAYIEQETGFDLSCK